MYIWCIMFWTHDDPWWMVALRALRATSGAILANNPPQILATSSSFGIRIEYELGGPKKFKLFFPLETDWDSNWVDLISTTVLLKHWAIWSHPPHPPPQVEFEYVVATNDQELYFMSMNLRQDLKSDCETMVHTALQKVISVLNCKTRMERVSGPLSNLNCIWFSWSVEIPSHCKWWYLLIVNDGYLSQGTEAFAQK